MTNIYARTFMIATLTDTSETAGEGRLGRGRGAPGWTARVRHWIASHAGS